MLTFLLVVVLALLLLVGVAMQKTYSSLPRKEFKRRAQMGDELAALLYRAVAYGQSLDVLLWLIIGLCSAGVFVILSRELNGWLAFLVTTGIIWLGFAWLPASRVTKVNSFVTAKLTPVVAWLLRFLFPVLNLLSRLSDGLHPITIHTGLYQKEDLLDLIATQRVQADNRVDEEALRIAQHALTYGDKLIRDVMVPRNMVRMVSADDSLGPVLLAELHESGYSRFPVYKDSPDKVVGTLHARDLVVAKTGGKVSGVMQKTVYYVHEDESLDRALQAFLKTKHHLFMVVNEYEEIVGIITIEDVLEHIIGKKILDEFDQYEDLRAVAQLQAKQTHNEQRDKEI